ncbi:MAG: hypothetical protein KTR17_05495 [Cellvibrionaceae bacterium]|nr:hypothetical protein [Cellvibrionaceae bacterium]
MLFDKTLFNKTLFYKAFILSWCFLLLACDKHSDNQLAKTTLNAATKTPQTQAAVARGSQNIAALKWVQHGETYNPEAPIPSQCYTKTDGKHNPCYVCHQTYTKADTQAATKVNALNDGFLQGSYAFSDEGAHNSWANLFKDRRPFIESVSDAEILDYINQDNYSELVTWMKSEAWSGEVTAIENLHLGAAAFDENGLALDGSGWVAFNYKPLPSTFWPTNGNTDDVMIRLAEKFRQHNGEFSEDVYFANLALLEMAIKDLEQLSTQALNEAALDLDLDGDGVFSVRAEKILRREHFVGDASDTPLTAQLYPVGTEFLHTVRYLGLVNGDIVPSKRMKEVRYLRKKKYLRPKAILSAHYAERKEKHFEKLPTVSDYGDEGMGNRHGWTLWGFIENAEGKLRKQHFEEQFFCVGCHKSVGSTIDQTYSFPRKVAGAAGWGYIDLKKIPDVPNVGETQGEYLSYLQRVGGGDEFRQNTEMLHKWFNADGSVKQQQVAQLNSIYALISPSTERALMLNKAYLAIVKEQSYLYGRDTTIAPAQNVFQDVDRSTPPLQPAFRYQWDIRLAW